jgi:hypothetical protein
MTHGQPDTWTSRMARRSPRDGPFRWALTRRALLQASAALALARPASAGYKPIYRSAAEFIGSIGVNTHISSEPYLSRFSKVRDLFRQIGIRHARDELRPTNDLDRWRDLHETLGVSSQLLVSPATNTVEEMLTYLDRLGVHRVSAIEGQNEGDADWFMAHAAAKGNWSRTVVDYQREVYRALRARYDAEELPIVSPTVINWKPRDMRLLKGAADYCDVVALHSYVQKAQEPETTDDFASLDWYIRNVSDTFKPGAPLMVTEAGYNNLVKPGGAAVSEAAASIYMLRLLLHNFSAGVRRTFLYQLLDGGDDPGEWEHHFGLVRHDDSPKPAFHAIASLIKALDEHEVSGEQKPLTLPPINITLREGPSSARMVCLQKRDGDVVVALWRPVRCWDVARAADIPVSPRMLTVLPDRTALRASILVPNDGEVWRDVPVSSNGIEIAIGGKVVLLRLGQA